MSNLEVSVVIAARNEAELLPSCLVSLLGQATSFSWEIIVVDNGSKDNTEDIAKSFAAEDPRIRVFLEPRPGTPKARNLGAKKAAGEILVFTDADCTFTPNWLAEITQPFREPSSELPVGIVGGAVTSAFRRPDWPTLIEHFADTLFQIWEGCDRTARFPGFLPWAPTCNLAIRKDLFDDLGRFEENWTIGYDPDLCWRVALNGFTVLYRETAEVFHLRRGSLWALLRQTYNYAYYNAALFSTYHHLWKFKLLHTAKERLAGWPERLRAFLRQPKKFWPLSFLVSATQLAGKVHQKLFPTPPSSSLTLSRLGQAKIRQQLPPTFTGLHKQGFCHWLHEEDLILFQPQNKKRFGLNPSAQLIWESKVLGNELHLPEEEKADAQELEAALRAEGLIP